MNHNPDGPMRPAVQAAMLHDRFGADAANLPRLAIRLPRYRGWVKPRYRWREMVDLADKLQLDLEAQATLKTIQSKSQGRA